jgi:hypothetical protein
MTSRSRSWLHYFKNPFRAKKTQPELPEAGHT